MAALHNLKKILRFGSSTSSFPFGSKSRRFVVGHPSPSCFPLQNHKFLCTHIIPSQNENFTVNYLIKSCGLSPQGAISASKWVKLQTQEGADSVLVSLRNHGFSQTQISQVVRSYPRILACNFEKTLSPKLHYFTSVGVSTADLAKIVASNPALLKRSLENYIIPTHNLLRSVLPQKSLAHFLRRNSRIFTANHSTSLTPNISLLRQLGMPQSRISFMLVYFTRLLILKHESFAQLVGEAREMGFDMKNTTSVWAIIALRCKNTLNRTRQVCVMRWGWSEDDFLSAFRRYPDSMIVSEKKLTQVMDFMVNKMGWPSVIVAKHPSILNYSLEKRIIPRCSVFKVLLSKGLINEHSSLISVFSFGEERFLQMFVTKFVEQIPQLLLVYQGKVDIHDVIS